MAGMDVLADTNGAPEGSKTDTRLLDASGTSTISETVELWEVVFIICFIRELLEEKPVVEVITAPDNFENLFKDKVCVD